MDRLTDRVMNNENNLCCSPSIGATKLKKIFTINFYSSDVEEQEGSVITVFA